VTKLEVRFRKRMIAERLRQIEGELAALEEECIETEGTIVWKEAVALRLAAIHTAKAAEELEACQMKEAG
jgi:hypothetical protein